MLARNCDTSTGTQARAAARHNTAVFASGVGTHPKAHTSEGRPYGCSWHTSGEKYNGVPTWVLARLAGARYRPRPKSPMTALPLFKKTLLGLISLNGAACRRQTQAGSTRGPSWEAQIPLRGWISPKVRTCA